MHFPLGIAILALLALVLLPALERLANSEITTKDLRSFLIRVARWTTE